MNDEKKSLMEMTQDAIKFALDPAFRENHPMKEMYDKMIKSLGDAGVDIAGKVTFDENGKIILPKKER